MSSSILKKFDGRGTAVIKLHRNLDYDNVYELITQLTDDGVLFDTLIEAVEDVKDEDGNEPSGTIDC